MSTNYQLIGPDPEHDPKAHMQRHGGILGEGNADLLLSKNPKLYKAMKGNWSRTDWNKSGNIKTTTWRDGNKLYITREQLNAEYIAEQCKAYRELAEQGWIDPLAPITPDGKLGYKWMEIPEIIAKKISEDYFGGIAWQTIKLDKTMKAQFYMVVQSEYPQYICYPGGKLPIPVKVPYPSKERFHGYDFLRNDK
ncbi:MAG TPA: hypothetical protein VFM18_11695 [Methanosarcina sp.]|nr:hypothetical protein [Methanosarcina sp.]